MQGEGRLPCARDSVFINLSNLPNSVRSFTLPHGTDKKTETMWVTEQVNYRAWATSQGCLTPELSFFPQHCFTVL